MSSKIQHVIADAGAFIRRAPLRDIGENIYTIPQVVQESRDKATRQLLASPTFDLKFKEPSSDALKIVTSFAKLTGDYGFLSMVDLKVLALTYDIEKQFNGTEHISKKPSSIKPQFTSGTASQGLKLMMMRILEQKIQMLKFKMMKSRILKMLILKNQVKVKMMMMRVGSPHQILLM